MLACYAQFPRHFSSQSRSELANLRVFELNTHLAILLRRLVGGTLGRRRSTYLGARLKTNMVTESAKEPDYLNYRIPKIVTDGFHVRFIEYALVGNIRREITKND